jgi:ribosomal protein S12 methylthiotransferase accessory factor
MAAVEAALGDRSIDAEQKEPSQLDRVELAIVVAATGDKRVQLANRTCRTAETPLLIAELGGIGGYPVTGLNAAISGFGSQHACFECLKARVAGSQPTVETGEVDAPIARLAGAILGRMAIKVLAGDTSPLGRIIELPYASRQLLPVSGCRCEPDTEHHLRRGTADRSLDETLNLAEVAIDPRVGIIEQVAEAESFPVPYYLSTVAQATFSDAEVPRHAAGVAADWNPAYMKAIGESLERYAAAIYSTQDLDRGPPGAVGHAVPPAAFVTAPEYDDPDPRTECLWVKGEHLSNGTDARLPAEFVLFPPPQASHRPAITTGLGLESSGTGALLSGLYEVIERDAAMLAWYSTYDPLGLEVADRRYLELERRLQAVNLTATALLLTQDIDVPVVAVCVHRPLSAPQSGKWPQFAAGMAASLNPADAALGALEEAVQNFLELRGMGRERAVQEQGAIGKYGAFPEVTQQFVTPATTVPASTVGPDVVPDGHTEFDNLLTHIEAADLSAYGARLTTRDLEVLGFEAVRVVVPSAQPLFTETPYFGKRATDVPKALGFRPRPDRKHHPFP